MVISGGSRKRGHFSVKMYAKTKELGPIGGACAGHAPPPDSPMVINNQSWNSNSVIDLNKACVCKNLCNLSGFGRNSQLHSYVTISL